MENVKQRSSYFDNAKFILIFLVVLGHFIEPAIDKNNIMKVIYEFIYLFHMPAFIFISGYFTKSEFTVNTIMKSIKRYLLLYIIFQILFIFYTKIIGINTYHYTIFTPVYIYWYLLAMFVWNIMLNILHIISAKLKIELKYTILLCFVLGLGVGYLNFVSWQLSLSRIIVFFPFFMLGYYFKTNGIETKHIFKSKKIAISIMFVMLILVSVIYKSFNYEILFCANSYDALGLGNVGAIYRSLLYLAQLLMVFALFSIIPTSQNITTSLGERTLGIYVLHGFIVKALTTTSFYNEIGLVKMVLLFLFAVITVVLLSKANIQLINAKFKTNQKVLQE